MIRKKEFLIEKGLVVRFHMCNISMVHWTWKIAQTSLLRRKVFMHKYTNVCLWCGIVTLTISPFKFYTLTMFVGVVEGFSRDIFFYQNDGQGIKGIFLKRKL